VLEVLSVLLSDPDADWYGFDLCKRAGMKRGTIYPLFARLLEAGWVERYWEDIDPGRGGPPTPAAVPPHRRRRARRPPST
jgi:DNA-binding MarR family transcriptional regulator